MAKHISNRGRMAPTGRARRQVSVRSSVYDQVTERIIGALDSGVIPWRRRWQVSTAIPCNAVTNRHYHGVNLFLLGLSDFQDHRWLSFKQAKDLGGNVRQGETSSLVVFWKHLEIDPADGEGKRSKIPLLRHYNLFNVEQCDGLDLPRLEILSKSPIERNEVAERFFRSIPNPPVIHGGKKCACYWPHVDVVQMPPFEAFQTSDAYYAILFHELAHATGHRSRLNRRGITNRPQFGSMEYGREELVAELTSAFCCASLGLDNSLIDDAASYIDGWLRCLNGDSRAIIFASGQAQRAADYLGRGYAPENNPELVEAPTFEEAIS